MGYLDDLKIRVASLEQTNDVKEAEIQLLLNERTDVTRPAIAMSEMTAIILDMLASNIVFQKKNPSNEKAKKSKAQLVKLLNLNGEFDTVSSQNYSLKLRNRELLTKNMILRTEISELKKQIEVFHATTKEL